MAKQLDKDSQEDLTDFRLWRERCGLSRERLAAAAGVSATTVYRIEMGRVVPHPLTLAAIKRVLELYGEEARPDATD